MKHFIVFVLLFVSLAAYSQNAIYRTKETQEGISPDGTGGYIFKSIKSSTLTLMSCDLVKIENGMSPFRHLDGSLIWLRSDQVEIVSGNVGTTIKLHNAEIINQ